MIYFRVRLKNTEEDAPKPTFEVAPYPWDTKCVAQPPPITFRKVGHKHIRSFSKGNRAMHIHF